MPGKKDNIPSIKNQEKYEALRDEGMSKEKAARIANATEQAKRGEAEDPSKKGGKQPPYEQWTVDELQDRAAEIGIEGRSKMDKDELIDALRHH